MNDSILLDYLFVSVPEKDLIEERWVVANRLPTYYESLRVHYLVDGVPVLAEGQQLEYPYLTPVKKVFLCKSFVHKLSSPAPHLWIRAATLSDIGNQDANLLVELNRNNKDPYVSLAIYEYWDGGSHRLYNLVTPKELVEWSIDGIRNN